MSHVTNIRICELQYPDKMPKEKLLSILPPENLFEKEISHSDPANAFYKGDNLPILQLLLPQLAGKIDLIYIDPPFGTGHHFQHTKDQTVAFSDTLVAYQFLEFLRRRLILLREFLSNQGSIFVHIDKKIGHYVRIILDEVFGYRNFINDITRIKCNPKNFHRKAFGNYSDMVLFYAKRKDHHIWNDLKEPLTDQEILQLYPKSHPTHGPYTTHPLHAPGETLTGDTGKEWKNLLPPKGRHWRYKRKVLDRLENEGLIEWSPNGNPRKIVFAKDHKGRKIQDVWTFKDKGKSYVSYPTEKNQEMIKRIILHSSNPDSIILDAFAGSGNTLFIAHQLKRRWIGMDQSPHAFNIIQSKMERRRIKCNYFELG